MDYSATAVEGCVLHFYQRPTPELDQWLKRFQESDAAWATSFDLLRSTHVAVQFFGASTLRLKCRSGAPRLPSYDRTQLRTQLLAHVCAVHSPQVISTLHCAIATLAVWCLDIPALLADQSFNTLPLDIRLGVAAAIANEAEGSEIGGSQRQQLSSQLTASQPAILSLLQACTGLGPGLLECVEAWAPCGLGLAVLWNHGLLDMLAASLPTLPPDHVTRATTVLAEVCAHSGGITPSAQLYASIVPPILQLQGAYQQARAEDHAAFCEAYALLLAATGRLFLPELVSQTELGAPAFMSLLLEVTARGPYGAAETCLSVWEGLVYVQRGSIPLGPMQKLAESVVPAVLLRCQYEGGFVSWAESSADQDEFARYRRAARDWLGDLGTLVPAASMLKVVVGQMGGANTPTWQQAESVLFAVAAIAQELVPDLEDTEDGAVDTLIQVFTFAYSQQLLAHPPSAETALQCGCAYAEWLSLEPSVHQPILLCAMQALSVPSLVDAATRAYRALAVAAARSLAKSDVADRMIEATVSFHGHPQSSDVLEGTVRVILTDTEPDRALARLDSLTRPMVEHCLATMRQAPNEQAALVLCGSLRGLGTCVRFLDRLPPALLTGQHPVVTLLSALWPALQDGGRVYGQSQWGGDVTVQLCSLLQAAVSSAKDALTGPLSIVVGLAAALFAATHMPCCLDVVKVVTEHHGSNLKGFHTTIQPICETAIPALSVPNASPDLCVSLYELLYRTLLFCPSALLDAPILPSVLDLALHCMAMPEPDVFKQAAMFLAQLFRNAKILAADQSRGGRQGAMPAALQWLEGRGRQLCGVVVVLLHAQARQDAMRRLVDLLYPLLTLAPGLARGWLADALSAPSYPYPDVAPADRQAFLESVLRAGDDPAAIDRACRDFASLCHQHS